MFHYIGFGKIFYNNASMMAVFSAHAAIKGPISAAQGLIGGAAIDKCTSYALESLDKQRETSYYKNKPVKVSLESDFDNEPEIDFRSLTKTTQTGAINVILDETYTFEEEKAVSAIKNPEPIKKLSTHKDSVSTVVKIGVSWLATGVLPTVAGIAITTTAQKTVAYAKDWGNS